MLTAQDGRSDYVKVLDFGIARIADEAAVTKFKDGAPGTLEFMAPELFTTHNAPDPAIDQYALGILLYDILTGSPPFMGNDMEIVHAHLRTPPPRLSALRDPHDPVIPEALEDLAAALIAKDPKQRPTGAQTVARLMGLRPQLPPRSLRGVLALRTQVLAASQVGQALQAAQTFVLPYNRPDFAQTAQLQSVLRQLDEVEDQIARLGEEIAKLKQDKRAAVRLVSMAEGDSEHIFQSLLNGGLTGPQYTYLGTRGFGVPGGAYIAYQVV